jgi:hypothetical protein
MLYSLRHQSMESGQLKTSITAALLIAAAIIIWKFGPPAETPPQVESSPISLPQHSLTDADPFRALPSASDPITAPVAQADINPFEMVLGIEVRKDRDCTVEVTYAVDSSTGESRKIYSCIPNSPREIDPYTTYPDETLAGMAYGNAHAAEVLGLRKLLSPDPEVEAQGLELLLRSVALSNNSRGIAIAINARYSLVSSTQNSSDRVVDVPNVKRFYTLSLVSNTVSPGSMTPEIYRAELSNAGLDDKELDALAEKSRQILEDLAEIQTQITGDTHIREAMENA